MRAPWKLWVTSILSGIVTLMAIYGSANFLDVAYSADSTPLSAGKWLDVLSRPIIAFSFTACLLWGVIAKHKIGYWLTVAFWVIAVTYQINYTAKIGWSGGSNELERNASVAVNVLFLSFFSFMLVTTAFTKKIKDYFRKSGRDVT